MSYSYISDKVVKVRKPHQCRICGEIINKDEICVSYRGVEKDIGFYTIYFHHECFDYSNRYIKYDEWDYLTPGNITRQEVLEELDYV